MSWYEKIPTMDRQELRDLKKYIDISFKDFSRTYGAEIEAFFDPSADRVEHFVRHQLIHVLVDRCAEAVLPCAREPAKNIRMSIEQHYGRDQHKASDQKTACEQKLAELDREFRIKNHHEFANPGCNHQG